MFDGRVWEVRGGGVWGLNRGLKSERLINIRCLAEVITPSMFNQGTRYKSDCASQELMLSPLMNVPWLCATLLSGIVLISEVELSRSVGNT